MQIELTEEGRRARNEYFREYRKAKREKERARKIAYWNKKGEERKRIDGIQSSQIFNA